MGAASVKLGASRKLQSDAFDDFLFDDQKVSIGKWYNQMFFMILYLMIRKLQWLIDDQSESYTYMANQKVTLRWPIRKLHLDDQSESHTLMTNKKVTLWWPIRKLQAKTRYFRRLSFWSWWCPSFCSHLLKLLNIIISPHPSSKSLETDNCFISLLPFHLCLLKISKAMSMSSWMTMSLSMSMRWWMVRLVLWEYGA